LAKRKAPARPARPPSTAARHDEARYGDIKGALGTIRQGEAPPRHSWRGRLKALLAIMGPGLIVMAGQNYGTSLLWVLALLIVVVIVNQEMVVRLGAVTGVGHARLVFERFGRAWGAYSVGALFVLNFLTILTEFIGITLALEYLGLNRYVVVPIAALGLVAMTLTGSFQNWERFMYVFILASLIVIPLALLSHPHAGPIVHGLLVPSVKGGVNSTSALLIIAIVGTTVAPWQLFFQQSNVIDKRITPRWINYERADTIIGAVFVVVGAAALMITAAFAFEGTSRHGHFKDAHAVATGLAQTIGRPAAVLFAIVLLSASIIGAQAVTLATSYALGDAFGARHSLHRSFREAKLFYVAFSGLTFLAAGIVLVPHAPLGLVTTAVQALAGVLLPSVTVFLIMLCNDKQVLGPWANSTWLDVLASVIVGALFVLSGILVVTTAMPSANVLVLSLVLGCVLAGGLMFLGVRTFSYRRQQAPTEPSVSVEKESWTMPPLALLEKPVWSRERRLAMRLMWIYVLTTVVLLVVKAVQLGLAQ